MRIAYVITRGDEVGGAQVHVALMARHMAGAGHTVAVIAGGDASYFEPLRVQGVEVVAVPEMRRDVAPLSDAAAVRRLARLLRRLRPEVVSAHSSKAGTLARVAGRLAGAPTIFTAHGWAFAEGAPRTRAALATVAERLAAPLACRIIAVSERDLELARSRNVGSAGRLRLVRNGMPDVPASLVATPTAETPTLVMVARFAPPKDYDTLFEALARISSLAWEMAFVGDGPLLERYRQRAAEAGLQERVRFLGRRGDVAEILARADGALLVSRWEGLPRSLIEALRAGLPVIASDVGGARELVTEGVNGFLVPRADADALAGRLATLVRDAGLRARMGRASRARYQRDFTWERVARETEAVYRECVGPGI